MTLRAPSALLLSSTLAFAAHAADGDMRVLSDELTERGDVGVEFQLAAARMPRDAALEGHDTLRGLFEVSYGLADDWETSLQLPVVRSGGRNRLQGLNLEFQYVAPHDAEQGFYAGIRIEFGYAGDIGEPRVWTTEWKPILGWHGGRWHGVLNLGITLPVSGDERRATFEPTLRGVYSISRRSALGFEWRSDLGALGSPRADRNETLMAVFDTRWHKMDFTFGLGKGLNARSEGVTGKLLVSFELDD